MKQNYRILGAAALCCVVLAASSCASTDTPLGDVTVAPESLAETITSDTIGTETEAQYPELPEMDLDGKTVNVLIRTEWNYEFMADQYTGDTINDAVLMRNQNVEDAYHVKFSFLDFPGAWGPHTSFVKRIHNSVLAADGAYDIVIGYQAVLPYNVSNGDMMNLNELPYLQMDAPWWTPQAVDTLTVNNRCYMLGGDITVSLLEGIYCMYFNKTLAEEYDIENLYDLVRSGSWTHESLIRVIRGTSRDLDGDNKWTANDRYGFVTSAGYISPYLVTYETPTLEVAEDHFELIWDTEHTASVVEKLVDMAYNEDVYYAPDYGSVDQLFRNGQILLTSSMLGKASIFRDMEDDFGILPYPKYDESQKSYATSTINEVSMVSIPITALDLDVSALLTEALCRESHVTVAPAFYDIALKGKYTRDENSVEMIELIRNSLSFDIGWINSVISGVSGVRYHYLVQEKNKVFSSWYAANEASIAEMVEDLDEIYFGQETN